MELGIKYILIHSHFTLYIKAKSKSRTMPFKNNGKRSLEDSRDGNYASPKKLKTSHQTEPETTINVSQKINIVFHHQTDTKVIHEHISAILNDILLFYDRCNSSILDVVSSIIEEKTERTVDDFGGNNNNNDNNNNNNVGRRSVFLDLLNSGEAMDLTRRQLMKRGGMAKKDRSKKQKICDAVYVRHHIKLHGLQFSNKSPNARLIKIKIKRKEDVKKEQEKLIML